MNDWNHNGDVSEGRIILTYWSVYVVMVKVFGIFQWVVVVEYGWVVRLCFLALIVQVMCKLGLLGC